MVEGFDFLEIRFCVIFLLRRLVKWYRLVGIRVKERERRRISFLLCREFAMVIFE